MTDKKINPGKAAAIDLAEEELRDKYLDQVQGGIVLDPDVYLASLKKERPKGSDTARLFVIDGPYT